MSYFARKMVLYSFNKFGIFRSWTNIQWLWKFDLGFWQTSKLVYRKLKNSEKVFWRFQSLHPFPRKMVLYLWTKFCIFESCTNIQSLRRFELSFWQIEKQIHRKLQNREKFFGKFETLPCFVFPEKCFVFLDKILHFPALCKYSLAQKISFRLSAGFKTNL